MMRMTELENMIEIAREAGDAAHTIQQRGHMKMIDKDESLGVHFLTEADQAAHEIIVARLNAAFPDIPIISEEGEYETEVSPDCFLADPIDGTLIFSNGCDEWGTMVTRLSNWMPKQTVVYCPGRNMLLHAEAGQGCFLNRKRRQLHRTFPLDKTMIAIEMGPWMADPKLNLLPAVVEPLLKQFAIRSVLSAAYTIAALVKGEVGAWVNLNVGYPWDYAPALLCMQEVGGTAVAPDGLPLSFATIRKMGIVCAGDQEMLDIVLPITQAWTATQQH